MIAMSVRNSDAKLWATAPFKLQGSLPCGIWGLSADVFTPIVFSPNGRLVACGLADGSTHVWDTSSLKELYTFQQTDDSAKDLLFSPNSRFLSSAGGHTVQLWEISSQAAVLGSQLDCSFVTNAVFSPDSSLLIYGGYCPEKETGFLVLFDTYSGRQLVMFSVEGVVSQVAINAKGTQIAATVGSTVHFWMLH